MTTYDITTVVGQIRLAIGDTDITNAVFTDAEITHFYAIEGTINLAAAAALEAWAAKYGASADAEKIGDYSYSQKNVDKMLSMAQRLREKESHIPVMEFAEMDLTGETSEEEE